MHDYDAFSARARDLVAGSRMVAAQALSERYWNEPFTGRWFHVFADGDHPNEITANDLVAVSTLSVNVPADVSIWLLGSEGREAVSGLLEHVPTDEDLWDAPELLARGSNLWQLWQILETACWPHFKEANGMARTKISKLMAAKRPRLVPVFDSVIAGLFPPVPDHWHAFCQMLGDEQLRLHLAIASTPGAPEGPCLLRRIDAMLWMIGQEPNW